MNSMDSPADFLTTAYRQLAFEHGTLLQAARAPRSEARDEWLEKGDWQFLAAEVGAESIFFVDRDPVVVFAKVDDSSAEVVKKLLRAHLVHVPSAVAVSCQPGRADAA